MSAPLASLSTGNRIAFDKGAIMRRAYDAGRFALAACRTAADRRAQMSRWLRKAWQEAKAQAAAVLAAARHQADVQAALAQRAREAAAVAAQFGNDAVALRFEIEREHRRQHFQPARIDALRVALASMGA
jgi:hypothetical protein